MSRTRRRASNLGMHMIRGPQRPYGRCPKCGKMKPMYWVSRIDFLCYQCLKKSGHSPFVPTFGPTSYERDPSAARTPVRARPLPPTFKKRRRGATHQASKPHTADKQHLSSFLTADCEREPFIPPDPDTQRLWDQRRAAVERRAEEIRQEREERKQRLVQDDRPLPERVREYRRHRWS